MNKTEGFCHSVKVPRLYKMAAKIVQEVAEGGGSVKELVFGKKHFNTNALNALVSITLSKVHEINFLFKQTQLLQKESRLDPWLARILVTELLWGKKKLPPNSCKPIETVSGYEQELRSHLSDNTGLFPGEQQVGKPSKKPRYVRVNTLLITFEEAVEYFLQEGWILDEEFDKNNYKSFLKRVEQLEEDYFIIDMHVPNLLIFPSGTKFFNHIGYINGWIILQDKASCLPVHILNPPPGSTVLDMCAAPGMKTTQLASVLNDQGQIYAVERDKRRYNFLVKMVHSSGATNIKTFNKDILQCCPDDFPGVEYIVVDPSCSGSGMTNRIQFQEEQSMVRLEKLSGFQIKILRSALTKYPNVKRVVYSTCSVYPEENEDVVRQVLETNYLFKLVDARTVVKQNWLNFGSSDFGKLGEFCLYAKPEEDLTNGFFVAVFERVKEGEKSEFFDTKLFNYKKRVEEKNKIREEKFTQRQKEFERQYGPVGILAQDNNPNKSGDLEGSGKDEKRDRDQSRKKRKARRMETDGKTNQEIITKTDENMETNQEKLIIELTYTSDKIEDECRKKKKKHKKLLGSSKSIDNQDFKDEENSVKVHKTKKKNKEHFTEVSIVESKNEGKKHEKRKKEKERKTLDLTDGIFGKKIKKTNEKIHKDIDMDESYHVVPDNVVDTRAKPLKTKYSGHDVDDDYFVDNETVIGKSKKKKKKNESSSYM